MMTLAELETAPPDRVIELVRVVDAPRSLVFAVWTDVRHLEQWWGPEGIAVSSFLVPRREALRGGASWRPPPATW
jgi:uncharacterized protein YndB with AHSA1/START domain